MATELLFLALLAGTALATSGTNPSLLSVLEKVSTIESLTDDDLSVLASAEEDDLPEPVKRAVEAIPSGANVCCRNVPTTIVTKSRSAKRVTTHRTNYRAGNAHCHLWGWGRCAVYANRYRSVVSYVTEYYKDSVKGKCPEKDVVCCHLYVNVSGRCVNIHDLSKVSGNLVG